jgi:hypothetical protein
MAAQRTRRARQLQERLAAGEHWQDVDLVFCTCTGESLADSNLRRAHTCLMQRLGLPYIRLRDLRHTAATLLLCRGCQ